MIGMKKKKLFAFIALIGAVLLVGQSCASDGEECSQEEICSGKSVSSCCDDDGCYFTYNGTRYDESEIDQLAIDLGCTTATNVEELKIIKEQLLFLSESVRLGLFDN